MLNIMNKEKNEEGIMDFLWELQEILKERKKTQPPNSYTAELLAGDRDRILKKIAEEAGEVIIAAKNPQAPQELIHESADLLFHLLLLLVSTETDLKEVVSELEKRHAKQSKTIVK